MLESRGNEDLSLESRRAHLARGLRRQELDDDLTVERRLRRQKQSAHAAGRELALDDVRVTEGGLQLRAEVNGHGNDVLRGWLRQHIGRAAAEPAECA